MKKALFTLKIMVLAMVVITTCCKCKHKDNSPAPQPVKTGNYFLHFHTNIDTTETGLGDTAKTADGRKVVLKQAQLYICNIRLVKSDGSGYTIANSHILKTVSGEEYLAGTAPQGNYSTVSFDVGVDSVNNAIAPSAAQDTIFSHHAADMWFGSAAKGYIFLNFAGTTDTTGSKNGIPNYAFSYQIGSNQLKRNVTLPVKNYVLQDGYITHITIDYARLLNGIDIRTENKTATYDNPALAKKIADNIPSMFRYEE